VAWCRIKVSASTITDRGSTIMPVSNEQITDHAFLRALYRDDYDPGFADADGEELIVLRDW
jgi:hypothetical protein